MATFTKGDVVLFSFPYTDLSSRKLRPCLVLSNEIREDIILCQITSKSIEKNKYVVELRKSETIKGSLMVDSYIRTNMIFTATKKQIQRKLCELSNIKYKLVVENVIKIINKNDF